ncbi:hypothetical protein DMUE_2995 [Dictyocoela muelleri]|nr:hypothetical protein DMUE_2995 [Dictyocoela muelleri]
MNLIIQKKGEKLNESKNIIKFLHQKFIHPGITSMEMLARRYLNISEIKRVIKDVCTECITCNTSKEFRRLYGVTTNNLSVSKVNECISLDIKGPIKYHHFRNTLNSKYFYILAVCDIFSRYTESFVIYNTESITITSLLENSWIKNMVRL